MIREMKVLLLFSYCLLTMANEQQYAHFSIEDIEDVPYLHFDPMGSVRIYHQEWKMAIFYDMNDLLLLENDLSNYLIEKRYRTWEPTFPQYSNTFNEWTSYRTNIYASIGATSVISDRKGGSLFNSTGEIAKTFFGTLSESDAIYYDREFEKLIKESIHLERLIQNETHILMGKTFDAKVVDLITDNTLEQLEIALNQYMYQVRIVEAIIIHARLGQIHPSLLPYKQLGIVVSDIVKKVGEHKLIASPTAGDYSKFFSVSTINIALLKSNKICFEVRIPILEQSAFSLQHIVSLPAIDQPHIGLKFIRTTVLYILIDHITHRHIPMSYAEIKNCTSISQTKFCKKNVPKNSPLIQDACLLSVFNIAKRKEQNVCALSLGQVNHTIWYQLYHPNHWIGIAPIPELIKITCTNGTTKSITKRAVFLLKLKPGCTVSSPTVTLYSENIEEAPPQIQVKPGSLSADVTLSEDLSLAQIPEIKENILNPDKVRDELKSLDSILNEIKQFKEYFHNLQQIESKWGITESLLVICAIGLIIFVMYKLKVQKLFQYIIRSRTVTRDQVQTATHIATSNGNNLLNAQTVLQTLRTISDEEILQPIVKISE